MKERKCSRTKRLFCALLVVLMLFNCIGEPVSAYAATNKHPYYITINRKQNCITIYGLDEDGNYTVPVKAMTCSVGVNNATPTGTYSISNKYRWHELMGGVYGQYCSRIVGGVLFHSVYYSSTDPSTLSYNAYNKLGTTASHGCVRLNVADAKWIYDNCPSGTKIKIYDGKNVGPLGKPTPVRIDTSSKYRGWDPTDPNKNNPWRKMKPTIKGVKNITVERCAKTPNLRKGISATDYKGKSLKITVSGKLNMKKSGKYTITYKSTDALGNVTVKKRVITVKDTKKPTVTVKKSTIEIQEQLTEAQLITLLKKNVTAKDSGVTLNSKYVTVNADKLIDAIASEKSGTYTVSVYAKDVAGNKSAKVTFKVNYTAPKDETENPDENTENSGAENVEVPSDNPENPSGAEENSGESSTNPGENQVT